MASAEFKTKFSVIFIVIAAVSDHTDRANAEDASRITNGQAAVPHEFPFMAALHVKVGGRGRWHHTCGGSLVTKRHVVTAAHCYNEETMSVVLGAHDNTGRGNPQRIRVWKWHVHPGYEESKDKKSAVKNDIAVVILKEDAKFSQDVAVIPLPKTDIDESGRSCTAIGWGRTSQTGPLPKMLLKTDLLVKSAIECAQHFSPGIVHPGFSCVYGYPSGVCEGDSGGPLACRDSGGSGSSASPLYLYGVTSGTQVPCGGKDRFEVFTRVGYAEELSFVTNITSQEVTGGSRQEEVSKIAVGINVLQSMGVLIWLWRI